MKDKPLVSIKCLVYNHGPYLKECLEGFVMQKTSFKFEAIIHDDASTDNSADIIREYAQRYPDIIKPIYEKENLYIKHHETLDKIMYDACTGKYIAFCEGDDYWIDSFKLQNQIDFLEKNEDFGMCYTKCNYYYQRNKTFAKKPWGGNGVSFESLFKSNCIPSLTVVVKNSILKDYLSEVNPSYYKWKMGDYPIWLWFAYNSKIKFINSTTSIYRVLPNSASHFDSSAESKIEFTKQGIVIKRFYAKKYNIKVSESEFKRMELSSKLRILAVYGNVLEFFKCWCYGINEDLFNLFRLNNYRYLVFFIIPFLRKKRL